MDERQRVGAECTECRGLVSAVVSYQQPDRWHRYYPHELPKHNFPDVPSPIASAASEAHLCLASGGPRGAVALARAVVEATAKYNKITTGMLDEKIDALATKGLIRPHTQEAAHEVRHYGNEVAHGDLVNEPITPEEAAEVLVLMDVILREVFQGPAELKKLQQTRARRLQGRGIATDPASGSSGATFTDLGQGRRGLDT